MTHPTRPQVTVLGRRVVDEHVVGKVPGLVHDWVFFGG